MGTEGPTLPREKEREKKKWDIHKISSKEGKESGAKKKIKGSKGDSEEAKLRCQ